MKRHLFTTFKFMDNLVNYFIRINIKKNKNYKVSNNIISIFFLL